MACISVSVDTESVPLNTSGPEKGHNISGITSYPDGSVATFNLLTCTSVK